MVLRDTQLIILNYKRIENVLKIVYKFQDFMPILVINNNPELRLEIPRVLIHNNKENKWCIERWYWAEKSSFEYSIILDDDICPTKHCIHKLRKTIKEYPKSLVGIYGKNNLKSATKYEELTDVWCVDKQVDLCIGSCLIVKNQSLKEIWNDYVKPWGIQDRGDDLLISLALSHKNSSKHRTISTEVELLSEGNVGLNLSKDHYPKRWSVIKKFLDTYT